MDDNIVQFGQRTDKTESDTGDGFPENNYVVEDIDGQEFYGTGFLIFTPHHCAIMKDFGKGAVPILVVPLHRVRVAEMTSDHEDEAAG